MSNRTGSPVSAVLSLLALQRIVCPDIVDDFLEGERKPGISPKELYDQYCMFGEDPFIRGPGAGFSAWGYARQRRDELCQNRNDKNS
jgi:hypothetical protein